MTVLSVVEDTPKPQDSGKNKIAKHVSDLYEEYSISQYRSERYAKMAEGRKRYNLIRDPKIFPWEKCSNKTLGLDQICIDALAPRILQMLLAEEDFINAIPVGEEDAQYEKDIEQFLQWALVDNMKLPAVLRSGAIEDLLKDGVIDFLPVWDSKVEEGKVRRSEPIYINRQGEKTQLPPAVKQNQQQLQMMLQSGLITQQGYEDVQETKYYENYKVDLQIIPLSESFYPDSYENWKFDPYLRNIYITIDELHRQSEENDGPYYNITDDLVTDPTRTSSDNRDDEKEAFNIEHSQYSREVKLLEAFLYQRGHWWIHTFAPDSGWRQVRKQRVSDVYPYDKKPVHRIRLSPERKKSLSMGFLEKIQYLSAGVDDLYNIMIDAWTREVIQSAYAEEVAGWHKINKKVSLDQIVTLPKGANVKFPPANRNVWAAAMQFIELLLAFFERTTSIMDQTLGSTVGRKGRGTETYGGMNLMVQEGNVQHQYKGETLQEQFEELFTDIKMIYAANIPMDAKMRQFQNNKWIFSPIDFAALQGRYDIKIKISDSTVNKGVARKEAIEKFQALAQAPGINPMTLIEDFLHSYGHRDTSRYLNQHASMLIQMVTQNPELIQVIQQFMQQKQEQQKQQKVQQQAQDNIQRQTIQQQIERGSGYEDKKLVDQLEESAKKKVMKEPVENATYQKMIAGEI